MLQTPLEKFALGFLALAIVIFLGMRVLPGLNQAARLDVDQSSGLTPGNEAVEGALPAGQTFVPQRADFAAVDLTFETLPDALTLQVREWPNGQIVLLSRHSRSEGNLSCREPHQSGRGGTCRLEWATSVTLKPGQKYALLLLEWPEATRLTLWKSRNEYAQGCFVTAGAEQCASGDIFFRTYARESR